MAYVNVKYKGDTISRFSEGNKTLETSGKYCEDNIQIEMEESQNDILFHFDNNMRNYGKSEAIIANTKGLELSSEQHKFGTHSLKCGTTQQSDNITISNTLAFQSYDFTLDFWVFPTNLQSSDGHVPFSTTYRSLSLYLYRNRITLAVTHSSGSWQFDEIPADVDLSTNTWYHIAIVRSGSKIYVFLDGSKIIDINFGDGAFATVNSFTIASNTYRNGDKPFTGYIDEFRYIQGTAIWTENFSPPTEPYV